MSRSPSAPAPEGPDAYPGAAGFKEPTTSRDAAIAIEGSGRAKTLRDRVFYYFARKGEATADELARLMGESVLAIRPRLSELRAQGFIEPTGERRRMDGGGMGHVWRWSK